MPDLFHPLVPVEVRPQDLRRFSAPGSLPAFRFAHACAGGEHNDEHKRQSSTRMVVKPTLTGVSLAIHVADRIHT
ncbi:hypothetical protein [Roseibium sp. SCP14]|uniref:hypothetical protein n=1 Tax=Roseibium sp. SCP14 TaxID=3141375 RepID=UPI0033381F96